jgi:hypothetical protein
MKFVKFSPSRIYTNGNTTINYNIFMIHVFKKINLKIIRYYHKFTILKIPLIIDNIYNIPFHILYIQKLHNISN